MSRRLPACTGLDVLRALERGGFQVHHVKGSHYSLRHPERPELRVVVPVHRKDMAPGTLRSIVQLPLSLAALRQQNRVGRD